MNNKRQTIWLVSMLSLMVILSAYYLFTEDVTPAQNAGDIRQTETGGAAKTGADLPGTDGVQVTEVDSETGEAVQPGASADAAGSADKNADGSAVSPDDEAVLKEMTNLKGSQYFDELQRVTREKIDKRTEELNMVIADTKNHTQEDASGAVEELARLDDADQRMNSLEEKLLQDYDNAVVTEEETNFRVVVQASKLEKKDAVHILDLAAKELNVTPDRLSVQYVP